VLILCVTAAAALILAHRYHLGTAAILVGILGGLPGLYMAWAAFPLGPGGASSPDLATVADQLAAAVGEQWYAEAALRRLNDPYPLALSWAAADPLLTDGWDSLVKLAGSGAGWPVPPPAKTWAADPRGLAGGGGDLAGVLARVPTGRLVVLGEPGAGKTMLMVRLVLDLLTRRASGDPVPILASVGSWNPAEQDLRGWLIAQLTTDHPALADPPSASRLETTWAAALLAAGLIVLILDGLDEIPVAVRGAAISRINDALRPGEQLVVTCRSQQYRDAVRPKGGVEATLRGGAAIQLRPLDADTVRGYLCDDAAGPAARARWDPVLKVLGTEAPAGQALVTPLMVGLARAIYNPRAGELARNLRDPAELCNPSPADQAAVESLLFDSFIPAAYRPEPVGRWTAQDAQKWLMFLARHLESAIAGPDLAWWQLPLAIPRQTALVGRLIGAATIVGVIGVTTLILPAPLMFWSILAGVALLVWLAIVVATGVRGLPIPARGIRWKPPGRGVLAAGLAAGVLVGSVMGVAGSLSDQQHLLALAFPIGFGIAVVAGVGAWLVAQGGAPLDISSAASPPGVLARDRRVAIVGGVAAAAGIVAAFVLLGIIIVVSKHDTVVAGVQLGVGYGAWAGPAIGIGVSLTAAWPYYFVARVLLALHRRLPWPLMAFLADAHTRGVLRQVGAVYQFRHIELQHRLATRAASPASVL
jgi:hypothetical protein